MIKVAVNNFVRRQVKNSGKTYSPNLSFEQIASYAQEQLDLNNYRQGYRDGVIIIDTNKKFAENFVCCFTKINDNTKLEAKLTKRDPKEESYIQIRALNSKPAKTEKVELILYRHDILAENNEQTTNSEWELISFHALPKGIDKMPMGPITMMRNQLNLEGGTKALYSSEEWAESVRFWQKYAALNI